MDFEFDKEIDTLLRLTAQGESAFGGQISDSKFQIPNSRHLDADELSAFAENALPEKAKQMYLRHLADCGACRKILADVIALNVEQTNEAVPVEKANFVQTPTAWYQRFFAFPNLAYTMGALVLVFSGIAAYTVLQNVETSPNTEVSQTYERQTGGRGMSSDGDAVLSESYSANSAATANTMSSNAASMNSALNSAAISPAMPLAPGSAANSNAAVSRSSNAADRDLNVAAKPSVPQKEPLESNQADDFDADRVLIEKEAEFQTDGARQRQQQPAPAQGAIAQSQADIAPDSQNVRSAPKPTARREDKSKIPAESANDAALSSSAATATTNVGGKTFKRTNNVWYDAAYRGQATKNVARGTDEYRKLDAGLRGIAENLGGTVVVVWKSKAYRIQ